MIGQGLLHSMSSGRFEGKVYTDRWPDFKVVLFHTDFPELPLANVSACMCLCSVCVCVCVTPC